jgi:hypothetical protein
LASSADERSIEPGTDEGQPLSDATRLRRAASLPYAFPMRSEND